MKLRAVIYARCSTEEDAQKDALVKQVFEAKECVERNGWKLVDTYIESRSGTSTKNRKEYNRLYEDLLEEKFDIIVIKSQDRLMRNTKDWYLFIERLNTNKKQLYIYLENDFYTSEDALLAGIKAILAEEYSRELSKKINNAHRHRQQSGGAVILTSNTYGYRKNEDKSIEIIEEEAKIKRRMYELCIAGYGCRSIASILYREGVVNRNHKPFSDADVLRMIRSPLNKGTVVMNRFHYDFNTKQRVKNSMEKQYIYRNKIPAIVSEEIWDRANRQISERIMERKSNKIVPQWVGKNPGVSVLSGKICCGICGAPYYRKVRNHYKRKEKIYEWKCKRYLEMGRRDSRKARPKMRKVSLEVVDGCDNIHVNEEGLLKLLKQTCVERYYVDGVEIGKKVIRIVKLALNRANGYGKKEELILKEGRIQKQQSILLEKLLNGIISDTVYQAKQQELEMQLDKILSRMADLNSENENMDSEKGRLCLIEERIWEGDLITRALLAQMIQELDKIFVYPTYMDILIEKETIRINYGNQFNYYGKKQEERTAMLEMIRKKPDITAKELAECLELQLSGIQYRIRVLKREGRLYFDGKGGRGRWVVNEGVHKK